MACCSSSMGVRGFALAVDQPVACCDLIQKRSAALRRTTTPTAKPTLPFRTASSGPFPSPAAHEHARFARVGLEGHHAPPAAPRVEPFVWTFHATTAPESTAAPVHQSREQPPGIRALFMSPTNSTMPRSSTAGALIVGKRFVIRPGHRASRSPAAPPASISDAASAR